LWGAAQVQLPAAPAAGRPRDGALCICRPRGSRDGCVATCGGGGTARGRASRRSLFAPAVLAGRRRGLLRRVRVSARAAGPHLGSSAAADHAAMAWRLGRRAHRTGAWRLRPDTVDGRRRRAAGSDSSGSGARTAGQPAGIGCRCTAADRPATEQAPAPQRDSIGPSAMVVFHPLPQCSPQRGGASTTHERKYTGAAGNSAQGRAGRIAAPPPVRRGSGPLYQELAYQLSFWKSQYIPS
jgi:hypothetical protein